MWGSCLAISLHSNNVLANTVRILTLEEQNVDLRKQLMAPTAHRAKPQQQQELDNPIRLWQDPANATGGKSKQQPCCTVHGLTIVRDESRYEDQSRIYFIVLCNTVMQ